MNCKLSQALIMRVLIHLAFGFRCTDIDRVQVNILTSIDQMSEFSEGQVLVADMTDPDWEPIMPHGPHGAHGATYGDSWGRWVGLQHTGMEVEHRTFGVV